MQVLHDQLHDVVEIIHALFPGNVAKFIISHNHHEVEELLLSNSLSEALGLQPLRPLEREFSFGSSKPRTSLRSQSLPQPTSPGIQMNKICTSVRSSSSLDELNTREDWNRFLGLMKQQSNTTHFSNNQFRSNVPRPVFTAHHIGCTVLSARIASFANITRQLEPQKVMVSIQDMFWESSSNNPHVECF